MKLTVRPAAAAAGIAAATLLTLTACTFGTAPSPSPTAQAETPAAGPTPTVEPEPIDPLTTVAEIVVRPEHLDLLDAQGVMVSTLSYDAEASVFLGALETVLGAAPVPTEHMASIETPARTEYQWDGLMVTDDHEELVSENGYGDYGPFDMNVSVYFAAPTIGDGVTVRTVNGYQPGGDAQALAAELGEPWSGNGYDQVRVETGEPIGEQQPYNEYENAYSVAVNTWEWKGASNTIFAPWNFGIGHV